MVDSIGNGINNQWGMGLIPETVSWDLSENNDKRNLMKCVRSQCLMGEASKIPETVFHEQKMCICSMSIVGKEESQRIV